MTELSIISKNSTDVCYSVNREADDIWLLKYCDKVLYVKINNIRNNFAVY